MESRSRAYSLATGEIDMHQTSKKIISTINGNIFQFPSLGPSNETSTNSVYSPTATKEDPLRESYDELLNQFLDMRKELQQCKAQLDSCIKHDITPIMQNVFSDNKITIRLKQGHHPHLAVRFEDGMYMCYWGKRMIGYSPYRDGMLKEVNETLVFLWQEYVIAYEKESCARDAIQLHNNLVKNFEEC